MIKKNLKTILLLFLVVILVINLYQFITFSNSDHTPLEIGFISSDTDADMSFDNINASYDYKTSQINQLHFMIYYYNENNEVEESKTIGTYTLNNALTIYTMNPFNLFNKLSGNNLDSGELQLYLFDNQSDESNDIRLIIYCSSTSHHSKERDISTSVSVDDEITFDDYKIQFFDSEIDANETFLIAEGSNDSSKFQIVVSTQTLSES